METVATVKKSGPKLPRMVGTRFTQGEFEEIQALAEAAELSVCGYVRLRAIGGHIKSRIDKKAIDDAINELRMTKGLMKNLHNEKQRIPYALVQKCEQAIDRFLTLNPVKEDEPPCP